MALDFEKGAALLSAFANKERLKVLDFISRETISVGALAEEVGLSQSALSQHLAKLRTAKLVKTRRQAQVIYYIVDSEAVRSILQTLHDIFGDGEFPSPCTDDQEVGTPRLQSQVP